MGICGGCGSPQAAMRCAKCQGIMYCSVECQKKNWKLHKQLCREAKPQPTDGSSNGAANGAPPVVSFPATTNRRLDGRLYGASLQASAHVLKGLGVSSATALGEIAVAFEKLLAEGARADVQLDLRGDGSEIGCTLVEVLSYPRLTQLLAVLIDKTVGAPLNLDALYDYLVPGYSEFRKIAPIGICIIRQNFEALKLLLANGANVNRVCASSPGPATLPGGSQQLFDYPLSYLACSVSSPDDRTATLADMARMLCDAGADVNARGYPLGYTALHSAIACINHTSMRELHPRDRGCIARLLIDRGADVNAVIPNSRFRPLDFAAQNGLEDVMEALVAKGADPRPAFIVALRGNDEFGCTYLTMAVSQGNPKPIRFASRHGVDLDSMTVQVAAHIYIPILSYAAVRGAVECVKALIECGVDVNKRYDLGLSDPSTGGHENRRGTVLDHLAALETARGFKLDRSVHTLLVHAGAKSYADVKAARQAVAAAGAGARGDVAGDAPSAEAATTAASEGADTDVAAAAQGIKGGSVVAASSGSTPSETGAADRGSTGPAT